MKNLVKFCFRVQYYPTNDIDNAVEEVISRTYYRVLGLYAGLEHIFEVSAISGGEESAPAIATTTTRKLSKFQYLFLLSSN